MGEHFDNTNTIRELGLELTPIDVTVKKTIEWFREHGYITRRP